MERPSRSTSARRFASRTWATLREVVYTLGAASKAALSQRCRAISYGATLAR